MVKGHGDPRREIPMEYGSMFVCTDGHNGTKDITATNGVSVQNGTHIRMGHIRKAHLRPTNGRMGGKKSPSGNGCRERNSQSDVAVPKNVV